jgi:thioredoxin 1
MSVIHLTRDNFDKEIKDSKSLAIIDFWAPWCGPCQMMGPVFESLSGQYKGKIKFAKLNTDEHPELANNFQIQGIPTLIIVNGQKEIDRIVGFTSEAALKKKIDAVMNKAK